MIKSVSGVEKLIQVRDEYLPVVSLYDLFKIPNTITRLDEGIMIVVEVDGVDLQPCGGTHVANTAEIGRVVVTKIEKKSAKTRRVVLGFAE